MLFTESSDALYVKIHQNQPISPASRIFSAISWESVRLNVATRDKSQGKCRGDARVVPGSFHSLLSVRNSEFSDGFPEGEEL